MRTDAAPVRGSGPRRGGRPGGPAPRDRGGAAPPAPPASRRRPGRRRGTRRRRGRRRAGRGPPRRPRWSRPPRQTPGQRPWGDTPVFCLISMPVPGIRPTLARCLAPRRRRTSPPSAGGRTPAPPRSPAAVRAAPATRGRTCPTGFQRASRSAPPPRRGPDGHPPLPCRDHRARCGRHRPDARERRRPEGGRPPTPGRGRGALPQELRGPPHGPGPRPPGGDRAPRLIRALADCLREGGFLGGIERFTIRPGDRAGAGMARVAERSSGAGLRAG